MPKRARSRRCSLDHPPPKLYRTRPAVRASASASLPPLEPPASKAPPPAPSASTTTSISTTASSDSSLPLTSANLDLLQNSIAAEIAGPRAISPPGTRNANLDTWDKLAAHGVHVDTGCALPAGLEAHVESIIRRARAASREVSANSEKVAERRRRAAQQNKRTGMRRIEPYLLFRGEADDDERVDFVPRISSKDAILLNTHFRPRSTEVVKATFGELSQPRPDTCIGYVTGREAETAHCQAAFSADEEHVLRAFQLSQHVHFPFLTSQWKAQTADQNMLHARYQAARDGAVIVTYLRDFYKSADVAPSVVQTCHFSLTCDLETAEIWIHWQDGDDNMQQQHHHMELIKEASLRDPCQVEAIRNILHNIVEYSLGERLTDIKNAIPSFARRKAQGRVPAIPEGDCMAAAGTHSSASSSKFVLAITPSSSASRPVANCPPKKAKSREL